MKQSVTVGAQLLRSGRYGCNNGRYGCTIVMSYIEINKAVSQWLLTFNLCVSVTWPLTCAFHIPCTHTPEIIDMHRGMCDNLRKQTLREWWIHIINPSKHEVITPKWLPQRQSKSKSTTYQCRFETKIKLFASRKWNSLVLLQYFIDLNTI